jgi:hypothetical protein
MHITYFHLRDGTDELLDPEGVECSDIEAIKAKSLHAARDLIAEGARKGLIDLRWRIEAEDETGGLLHTLHFEDAVTIERA